MSSAGSVSPRSDQAANPARIHDYLLGGRENYAVDRRAAEHLLNIVPATRQLVACNRRFLHRAIRYAVRDAGIRQFLDIGSGLPAQENLHQTAQRSDPSARVVYVDNDPVVVAHGRALLAHGDRTAMVTGDVRDMDTVLGNPEVTRILDLAEPVAALLATVLSCLPDRDRPGDLVRGIADRLPAGSVLVFSHPAATDRRLRTRLTELMLGVTGGMWGRVRDPEEFAVWFEGLELVPPGLVEVSAWRPDPGETVNPPSEAMVVGAIARVP
ncbi:SAM-dependent methyltransferase [Thermomonospora cellulosilytica]|uniref:SAM-dependent methyltransferase n=1 Tax=Thermomonospora cellulosilytica TaxID=1411118 RepID=A0A7W3MWW2_9ACTN|nr:SAM-dependent methyltransferase [Thermomonospora cellulosilytica]MBA9003399.1 SAM-dependent methyltransferase [Thermomonospora cellulosilytica]